MHETKILNEQRDARRQAVVEERKKKEEEKLVEAARLEEEKLKREKEIEEQRKALLEKVQLDNERMKLVYIYFRGEFLICRSTSLSRNAPKSITTKMTLMGVKRKRSMLLIDVRTLNLFRKRKTKSKDEAPPNDDVVKNLIPIQRKKRVYGSDSEDEEVMAAKAGKKSNLSEAIIQDSDEDMPAQPSSKPEESAELADLFGDDE